MTLGLTFTGWLIYSYQSHGVDAAWMADGDRVRVWKSDDYYQFIPSGSYDKVVFFYPGAMVDPKAYVPICRQIAEHGIHVFLIKMPGRMAMYGYNKPWELGLLDDTTKTYILAGHSQGAKMAAQFVYEHPGMIDKLILIGTTHPRDISLAQHSIPVLKIYGTRDGVANDSDVLANRSRLPDAAKFVRIDGANHSQFGYYGSQFGDHEATITREQQQAQTLNEILTFIN